jgi:hypothetical protein
VVKSMEIASASIPKIAYTGTFLILEKPTG